MNQQILDAYQQVKNEIVLYNKVVSKIRSECMHCFVVERTGHTSEFFRHPTIRICVDCGLEEQGDTYASSRDFVKLKSEFVKQDDYNKYRLNDLNKENNFKQVRYGRYLSSDPAS